MDLRASRRFFNEPGRILLSLSTESAPSPRGFQGLGQRHRFEWLAITPREARPASLRENVQAVSAQRRGKIAQRRGRFTPYLSAVFGRTRLR